MIIIIYIIILTVILMNTPIQIHYPKIIIPQEQNRNIISNYIPQITNPNSAFIPYNNFHQRLLFPDIFYLNNIFYQNCFFNHYVQIVLMFIQDIMQRECVQIVIIQKEE